MCAIPSKVRIRKHTLDTPYPVGPVHIYLYEGESGYILFDTGPPTPSCFSYLERNIPLKELEYVVITHSHADHCGAAAFLAENTEATILIPGKDIAKHRMFGVIQRRLEGVFADFGFPKGVIDRMKEVLVYFKSQEKIPPSALAVEDGGLPPSVSYMPCPGHSLTDFVYFVEGECAITGDFLLNGVFQTPLIEIDPETMNLFDNYSAYCRSIEKIERLMELRILPAHGSLNKPEEAVEFYVDKILKRAVFMGECLKKDCTLFDAVRELTDPYREPFKAYLKASELMFFKSFLENPSLLFSALDSIGMKSRFAERFRQFGVVY